jgi:hypothetical protein
MTGLAVSTLQPSPARSASRDAVSIACCVCGDLPRLTVRWP